MEAKEKRLWNEAVKATLAEVKKYDGILPDPEQMDYLIQAVSNRVKYKNIPERRTYRVTPRQP